MSRLIVVATPIGNLSEMTPRAVDTLRDADLIAAEDTRVTIKLLNHFHIDTPMISYHQHNEKSRSVQLIERMLQEDLTVALVSDAGTPGISDPGHELVARAHEYQIPVSIVSGPSALAAALSVCGFAFDTLSFFGFLPRRARERDHRFREMRNAGSDVVVLYESPHRIRTLIRDLGSLWPDALLCVCSDLSKRYESIRRGSWVEVLAQLEREEGAGKGEYTVVALPRSGTEPLSDDARLLADRYRAISLEARLLDLMIQEELTLKAAQNRLLEIDTGLARNDLYSAALRLRSRLSQES